MHQRLSGINTDRPILMKSPSVSKSPIGRPTRSPSCSSVIRTLPYPQNGYGFLGMNVHDRKVPSRPHPILADAAVRREF